jgi:outer membrane protein assembly factor BamB
MSGPGEFEDLGIPIRKAGYKGCLVAPEGSGKRDLLYFNFNQSGDRLFILAVDPDTGEAEQHMAPEGPGAWGYILGPDGRIYLGTWDGGLILRFDPRRPDLGIRVVGKPSESEGYIWMFALGGDGKLYGGTYGNAKLISIDPRTDEMNDLGRMDETQMYSRTVAAGSDGRIYIGIGTERGDVIVYDPNTGIHRSILPAELKKGLKSATTMEGRDGHAYASVGDRVFRCENCSLVPAESYPGPPEQRFRDGRILEGAGNGFYEIRDTDGRVSRREFTYSGTGVSIFYVATGPSGRVYGSSCMPLELFEYDPSSQSLRHLGNPTSVNGEIYSMAALGEKLYICAYPGSWLSVYDPAKPWSYGTEEDSNPRGIGYAGDGHLRPRAMVVGPGGKLYIGSLPPYGEHGGAMGVYDPQRDRFVENHRNLIPRQGIVSLVHHERSGLIVGGSSISGGGGTKPVEKEAHLFAWDPAGRELVLDTVPVEGDSSINAMTVADDRILAASHPSGTLLSVDPSDWSLDRIGALPHHVPDLCLGNLDGRIYGISGSSIFRIIPDSGEIRSLDAYPGPINAGFALSGGSLYFASGSHLIRYTLPE